MSDLKRFENNLFQLEVKTNNGESLFNAEMVAKSLGIVDTKNDVEYVRWQRVNQYLGGISPQVAKGDFIPEPMVYKLAFKANNALAEKFQDWLATEVLPTIRKHGMYATEDLLNNPDLLIQVATQLKEEKEQRLIAEQRVMELQPKASYYDLILQNKTLLSVTQIAKDYGKSAVWLNNKLHELGIQFKQGGTWLLYQKFAEKGYTQSTTHIIDEGRSRLLTKWTQKGRLAIYELLKDEGVLPLIEIEELQEV